MKAYEELKIRVVFSEEDAIRCSNIYDVGDDAEEDIFG